jgi:peptide/nickel transport system permease protein
MSWQYLVRRILLLFLVIWAAATINFILPRLSPRDPIMERLQQAATQGGRNQTGLKEMLERYRQDFGLLRPWYEQYVRYVVGTFRFDFGFSIAQYPRKVTDVMRDALPWTIGLGVVTTILGFLIGTLLGAVVAWPRSPKFLQVLIPPFMVLNALPFFVLALILIYFFAFQWKVLPLSGAYSRGQVVRWNIPFMLDILRHALLPAFSIILVLIGGWALGMRSLMKMTTGEDYITYAEAKGLKSPRIFSRYAMRNALLPQVTGLALSLGGIATSTLLVETVFQYPGLGSLLNGSIQVLDYNMLFGIGMIIVFVTCIATFLVDLLYPLLDPRIRYERG